MIVKVVALKKAETRMPIVGNIHTCSSLDVECILHSKTKRLNDL